MDPDATLDDLLEAYNLLQNGDLTLADAEEFIVKFDALDTWIRSGGYLPAAWQYAYKGTRPRPENV